MVDTCAEETVSTQSIDSELKNIVAHLVPLKEDRTLLWWSESKTTNPPAEDRQCESKQSGPQVSPKQSTTRRC